MNIENIQSFSSIEEMELYYNGTPIEEDKEDCRDE